MVDAEQTYFQPAISRYRINFAFSLHNPGTELICFQPAISRYRVNILSACNIQVQD